MGSFKVKILGAEYNLKGSNESVVIRAAQEVDHQLGNALEKYKEESLQTAFTMAALNIAEKLKICEIQSRINEEYFIDEIKKITLYLIDNTTT